MSRHIAHNEKITGVTKQPHGEVALQTETTEVTHEPTLFAEPIVAVGGFTITNSLVMTWAVVLIVVAISIAIKFSLKMIPKGIQNIFEMVEYRKKLRNPEFIHDDVLDGEDISELAGTEEL